MRRKTRFRLMFKGALSACLVFIVYATSGLTQGELIVTHALAHLDAPYKFAASGPSAFDCSGFVLHCLKKEGFRMNHAARSIGADGRYRQIENIDHLMVGDVVCFDTVRDDDPSDHVGFYMGGGQFVHASSAKGKVVVSDLSGFYLEKFTGARRAAQVWF